MLTVLPNEYEVVSDVPVRDKLSFYKVVGFPLNLLESVLRNTKTRDQCRPNRLIQTWRFNIKMSTSSKIPAFPQYANSINLIRTCMPSDDTKYTRFITDGFDMVHCSVAANTSENGWVFEESPGTLDCLLNKRIRIRDGMLDYCNKEYACWTAHASTYITDSSFELFFFESDDSFDL